MVLYLVALSLVFFAPLLFEQYLVCLSVVYLETAVLIVDNNSRLQTDRRMCVQLIFDLVTIDLI